MLDLEFVRKVAQKVYSGHYDEAHAMIALACQTDSSPLHQSECHRTLGECLIVQSELARAEVELRIALRQASGHLAQQAMICLDLLGLSATGGYLALGEEMERTWIGIEPFAQIDPEVAALRGRFALARGYLSLLRRETHAAAAWFWTAVQFYTRPNSHPREGVDRAFLLPTNLLLHAHTMLKLHKIAEAKEDLTLAADWVEQKPIVLDFFVSVQADICLHEGDLDRAAAWVAQGTDSGWDDGSVHLELARARVAAAQGDYDASRLHLNAAQARMKQQYRGYLFLDAEEIRHSLNH